MSLLNTQPAIDWIMQATGLAPRLTLNENDGLLWISDGRDRLAIVHRERADRYRHGISRRCRRMTEDGYLARGKVQIRPGDTVVNVGANIGEVATYLAGRGAHVLALEPDPIARRCLMANATGLAIEVLPWGAWREDGELVFYLATEGADSSAVNPSEKRISIVAKTIDTIVREAGLEHVRLIVGDAEGAEPEVLAGASATLAKTAWVALDCGAERGGRGTFDACADIVRTAGFEVLPGEKRKYLVARNLRRLA